jgi:hypothetical protein
MPTAFKTGGTVASSGLLTDIDLVARNPLGSSVPGNDALNGAAEFVYLQGAAAVIAGSVVLYDENGQATLVTALGIGPVAVALGPVLAGQFGWFAVRGTFPVDGAANIADNGALGFEGASGRVGDGFAAGGVITGMIARAATGGAAALVLAQLLYPWKSAAL